MDVRIRVEDDEELASLYRWLSQDPDVLRSAALRLEPGPARPGDMGGAFETIHLIIGDAVALGGLAIAFATWRGSRPRPPAVRFERAGTSVEITDPSPEAVERILRSLADGEREGH